MRKVHAAVVEEAGGAFALQQVQLDEPRPDEVVVRIVAAGICHTDLTVRAGGLPFPLPGVLGHEGAGVVEAVGPAVTRATVGDHVVLTFTSCGRCGSCRGGHPAYCDTWLPANFGGARAADGSHPVQRDRTGIGGSFFGQSSFATYAVVQERCLVVVEPDLPLDVLAPLGCGIQTGTGTVLNTLRPHSGQSLAVFGAGTVGLAAIMATAWTGAGEVIAIDLVDGRLRLAAELGATQTINATGEDVATRVRELTGGRGVDHAIECTGNTRVLRAAVDALAIGGTCAAVGAPPFDSEVAVPVNALLPGRRLIGVTEGDADPESLIPFLAWKYRTGQLPLEKLITRFAFAEINAAAEAAEAGEVVKPVLSMG